MNKRVTVGLIALSVATAITAQPRERSQPIAREQISGMTLTVSPDQTSISSVVRVSGPAGYEATVWSEAGGAVTVDLLAAGHLPAAEGAGGESASAQAVVSGGYLPDGRYGYEAIFYPSEGKQRIHSGVFFVEGGVATSRGAKQTELRDLRSEMVAEQGSAGGEIGAEEEFFSYYVAIGGSNYPNLRLETIFYDDWRLYNLYGDISFENRSSNLYAFTITNYGRVGVGTTNPMADLHILRAGGNIRITDADVCPNPNASWEIEEDFGKLMFEVVDNCSGDAVGGKMWIHGNGNVGIGQPNPAQELEIAAAFPTLRFNDDEGGVGVWDIDGNNFGFTLFDRTNGGIQPLHIQPATPHRTLFLGSTGRIGIGTGAPQAKLHVMGSGRIEGDVALASSRTLKTGFGQVNPAEMLARVADLPLALWRYKSEDENRRHIGPFAEDFQRLFGLGDGETISVVDAQGVTLAAIQALEQELEQKEEQITDLTARLAAVEARLTAETR